MSIKNVEIQIFDKSLLVSSMFVKLSKLTNLIDQKLDVGRELEENVSKKTFWGKSLRYTDQEERYHYNFDKIIPEFIKLIDSYFMDDDTTLKNLSLWELLSSGYPLADIEYLTDTFSNVILKMVDFLEINDRLLLHTEDWMETVRILYYSYLDKYDINVIQPELASLERYLLQSKYEFTLGESYLHHIT